LRPELHSRRVPGHFWVRLGLSFTGNLEAGHGWIHSGIIRRDAWRVGRVGIYLLRMPHQTERQALARARVGNASGGSRDGGGST
jgi:hypothetical protein